MTDVGTVAVDRWQTWLALEHEAIWLYGVIGGRVDDLTDAARDAWNRHRDARDRLDAIIKADGAEPAGPQFGYADPTISSAASARQSAQTIEAKIAAAAMACIGDAAHRSEVVDALRASARAAAEWGAKAEAFPGLD